jgi:integrase
VLLGKHGTTESRQEYARVLAEWEANGRRPAALAKTEAEGVSINEVILAYLRHAEEYYRHPDGRPTSEVNNVKLAMRPLKALYGHNPAAAFDSLALAAVRDQMIRDGRCRNRVNKDAARVKRLFRWAASKRLVPDAVHQSLATVDGLRAGRSKARETAPVRPVALDTVEATLPHMTPQVAAMVRLQLLTGMRPGEVIRMRGIDLDTTGEVWVYRPGSDQGPNGSHKTAWRGHTRTVLIGPRAQEVLKPWLRLSLTEYLFQPREARAAFDAARKANRKTPITPSQRARKPKRAPRDRYTPSSYDGAIYRASDRLPAARPAGPAEGGKADGVRGPADG